MLFLNILLSCYIWKLWDYSKIFLEKSQVIYWEHSHLICDSLQFTQRAPPKLTKVEVIKAKKIICMKNKMYLIFNGVSQERHRRVPLLLGWAQGVDSSCWVWENRMAQSQQLSFGWQRAQQRRDATWNGAVAVERQLQGLFSKAIGVNKSGGLMAFCRTRWRASKCAL